MTWNWRDLSPLEWGMLLPMAFFVLYLGLAPTLCLKIMNPSLNHLLGALQSRTAVTLLVEDHAAKAAVNQGGRTAELKGEGAR